MNARRVSGSAGLPRSSNAPALHSIARTSPYSRPSPGSSAVPPSNELEVVLRELREMKKGQQEINAGIKNLQDEIKSIHNEIMKMQEKSFSIRGSQDIQVGVYVGLDIIIAC